MLPGDLTRTRKLAGDAGLDALLAFTPRNVGHLAGFAPANQTVTGVYWALLPTDPALPTALTVGEFDLVWARARAQVDEIRATQLWIEIDDLADLEAGTVQAVPKPVQFDPAQVVSLVRTALDARGLLRGRIGADLDRAPSSLVDTLRRGLPETELVDASPVFTAATMLKTEAEIDALRRAVALTEVGIRAALIDADPRGRTVSQLRASFQQAVLAAVADDPGCAGYEQCRVYLSAGGDIGPNLSRHTHRVAEGDVIWVDAGCQVDGYAADIGRTFTVGPATPLVRRIATALEAGSAAGFALLRPGTPLADIYRATQEAVRANGLPTYTRGHFGHGIGAGIGERAPYICADTTAVLTPGMALAFERPYYLRGLGGFQYEENFAVTEDGVDIFTSLPRNLTEL